MNPQSFIVINKRDGKAVFEFFDERNKRHINTDKYYIMTAAEYLPLLGKGI